MAQWCDKIWHIITTLLCNACSDSYNAKIAVAFMGYIVALCVGLPSGIELLHSHADTQSQLPQSQSITQAHSTTPLTQPQLSQSQSATPATQPQTSSFFDYCALLFLPFIWLVAAFGENFIGILVLCFGILLSGRLKILGHFALLFLLYLLCAYPSLLYGAEILPGFLGYIFEVLEPMKNGDYGLVFAFYSKGVVWVFLALAIFDIGFYLIKQDKPPRLAYENLFFSLGLYIITFGIYSYEKGAVIWH